MRVLVAGWAGSTNLGDELVLAGMLRELARTGAEPTVLSVDPRGTERVHGVAAVAGSDPRAVLRALSATDAVVLGGGGLLQDETGPFNLPYHLWRVLVTRRPVVGVGLGAGPLDTRLGRALVVRALRGRPVSVRDAPSAALLGHVGVASVVAADLALSLPDVHQVPEDRVVVALRPWTGARGRLLPASVRARRTGAGPLAAVRATAAALDELAARTGLGLHFVALQADRDGPLHDAVRAHLRTPSTAARPTLHDLPAEIGSGRVVVSTRYHGGVCAALAGRPAVLIGYSGKVAALAGDLGAGARVLPWRPDGPVGLVPAVTEVLPRADAVRPAVAALRERAARHGEVLATLS